MDSVECLSKLDKKWRKMCRLPLARSNAGVCALNDKIYCIGGWNGQSGIRQCDVLKPEDNKWMSIAPLNTGRYQAGVAAYQGKLWVAGGSDAWNCLGSVEVYDPETEQWTFMPSLLTPRYGIEVCCVELDWSEIWISIVDAVAVWPSSTVSCTPWAEVTGRTR